MLLIPALAGLVALLAAGLLTLYVMTQPAGKPRARAISADIRDGALAYLRREYTAIAVFTAVLAAILTFVIGPWTAITFIAGAVVSAATGWAGIRVATAANARTAAAASRDIGSGLRVAFASGSVMGLAAVGLGLFGIILLWEALTTTAGLEIAIEAIAGFGLGASVIALFARVGGGIFTKAADVGADLVGKVEKGIPEDDPRNAAVIADNVGDNVGDVAGMGADLLESYVSAIIATMVLGAIAFAGAAGIALPLVVAAAGIAASIVGIVLVRVRHGTERELIGALRRGIYAAAVLFALLSFVAVWLLMPEQLGVFWAILAGLLAGIVVGLNTEYFTLSCYSPTRFIARSAQTGAGTAIISGMAMGMSSTVVPIAAIGTATYLAYQFAGLYGIAIAGVGMLATLGITLASDAYGPVADNASGIAQMAGLGKRVRRRTDLLDELGNTTAATGKGFAIGSAALTTLGWIAAYVAVADAALSARGLPSIATSFTDPAIIFGLFLGGMATFVFCAMALRAVGKTAFHIVNEVRRQFREMPGIMTWKTKPDYTRCIDISTKAALREMIAPGLLAVAAPIVVGLFLGLGALAALLVGATLTGFLLAVMMANAGGSWDNAKKYIEKGFLGGKGSETHKAAVVGDTLGDPFKDTAGPSLNILIKLMSKVALVFVPLFVVL